MHVALKNAFGTLRQHHRYAAGAQPPARNRELHGERTIEQLAVLVGALRRDAVQRVVAEREPTTLLFALSRGTGLARRDGVEALHSQESHQLFECLVEQLGAGQLLGMRRHHDRHIGPRHRATTPRAAP